MLDRLIGGEDHQADGGAVRDAGVEIESHVATIDEKRLRWGVKHDRSPNECIASLARSPRVRPIVPW